MTKAYQTTSADPIEKFIADNNLTYKEMADLLHVSPSGLSGWLAKGTAPAWTTVALEGLQRRARRKTGNFMIFTIEAPISDERRNLINQLGLTACGEITLG